MFIKAFEKLHIFSLKPFNSVKKNLYSRRNRIIASCDFEISGRSEMLSVLRKNICKYVKSLNVSTNELQDIMIAVGEAGANAVKHGCKYKSSKIKIRVEMNQEAIKVLITDRGRGFDPNAISNVVDDKLSENGRGILCMKSVMDKVEFFTNSKGTRVELTKLIKNQGIGIRE